MNTMSEKKRRASKARVRNRQLVQQLRHERRNKWIVAAAVVASAFLGEMLKRESFMQQILLPTELPS